MFKKLFGKNKVIAVLGGKKVEVKSLPVGFYTGFLPRLEQLPAVIVKLALAKDGDDATASVFAAMEVCENEFYLVLSELTGLDREFLINKVAPNEIIHYLQMLAEVNEFAIIVEKLKRMLNLKEIAS